MEKYFNVKGLSEYLIVPEQTIRRWVFNKEIIYVRIHNIIRFRLSEIERWIDENREKVPGLIERGEEAGGASDGTEEAGGLPDGVEEIGGED